MNTPVGQADPGLIGRTDSRAPGPRAGGGYVVIADDDPAIRSLLAFRLRRAGCTIVQAADGAEALTACRDADVDLAILDVDMPALSGFEVLRELRADPATADLPVLLCTAHDLAGGPAQGLGLGAHDYIRKPFDLDEMQARVDGAILLGRRTRELADSEAAFRGLFDGAHTAMSILGLDGSLRRVNRAWTGLFGIALMDLQDANALALLHPHDLPAHREVFAGLRRGTREHDRSRVRILRPDAQIRWCDISTTLVRNRAGEPAYLYRVLADVTDEIAATQALEESERKYRRVVDTAAEGIWILDEHWVIRFANQAMADMLGRSVGDLLDHPLEEFLDAGGRDRAAEHRSNRERGITETVQNSLLHADGHLVWAQINATPIRDECGDVRGSLALLSDITERRAMETALAEREHRYAVLVDHLPGGAVTVLDRDLRVVTAGGAALHEAGYTPAAVQGRTMAEILPAADVALLRPHWDAAFAGRPSGTFQFTGSASGRTSLIDAVPLFNDGDQVSQILLSTRDITALKEAEHAQRSAEESFRVAFERAPVGMLLLRGRGIERANNAIAELLGTPAQDMIGRDAIDFAHPDETGAVDEALELLAVGETPPPQDRRALTRDGRTLYLHVRYSILSADTDRQPSVLIHIIDRTAEVDAEQARTTARKLFETAVDQAPIGMCLIGTDGRFLRVNAALCHLLQRDAETLLRSDFQSLTHPDDLNGDLALMRETLAGERDGYEMDKRYLTPAGHIIHTRLSVSIVRHPDGRPAHFISQIVDLTAQKHLQDELQQLADHDALTGLFNRRRFEEELVRETERTRRTGHPASLLMIDLDGFKAVNDSLGHRAGDQVLQRVAEALRTTLRTIDVLARLGGDEFAVVLTEADHMQATAVAARLREAITTHASIDDAHRILPVTASIGITPIVPTEDVNIEQLLSRADAAMYREKSAGRPTGTTSPHAAVPGQFATDSVDVRRRNQPGQAPPR